MLLKEQTLTVIGGRYRLNEQIGSGGMGAVYRATDRLTGGTVALKRVTVPTEQLQFASRADSSSVELPMALTNEFRMLASLRHPHIISVMDYGFDDEGSPFFTMNLLERAKNIVEAGTNKTESEKVQLIVQMLQALNYLHRRDILHRDLKPGNVLVVEGQVRVLDFGLSVVHDQPEADMIVGTMSYMAPEVLQGNAATSASDLYAVGVIAYELLAGRHPFDTENIGKLIQQTLNTPVDLQSLDVTPALKPIIGRLLSKQPTERYPDAYEVMQAFSEAIDQPMTETIAIRESYLQAARFVGRVAEFDQLSNALGDAIAGTGSAWLVAGESGVGKSRLLAELRTLALVRGALVLSGQAVAEGGSMYQLWRDALRRLVLHTELTPMEASVLKGIVPDIGLLLERDVADAPPVDAQAIQERLLSVIEAVFRRQQQPMALILEDLHWSSESLDVLIRLTSIVRELPLIVIGSYRDDERPDLPTMLPAMRVLKLERLPPDNIAKLSASMLGEAGRQPEVIEFLQRETEGNVFFLVEIVRALAEEAGELNRIATMELPKQIFAGGIQRIIQRRINRVPESARVLLEAAAIAGRQLDLDVLKAIAPQTNVDEWLNIAHNAAVLEVYNNEWRFAHDKLREGLLADLPPNRSQALHRQVAEGIEKVYKDREGGLAPFYASLAHHWLSAKDAPKALDYLEKAGLQALENFANPDALDYFAQALALDAEQPTSLGAFRRAWWKRNMGQAYFGLGNLTALRREVEEALGLAGRPIPDSAGKLNMALLKQLNVQTTHRLLPVRKEKDPRQQRILLEVVRAYRLLGNAYFYMNEAMLTVYTTLQQLNLSERMEPTPELTEAYANMCVVAGLVPMHSLAELYSRRSREMAAPLGDYVLANTIAPLSLYCMGAGKWDAAMEYLNHAIRVGDEYGDRRLWESVTGVLAITTSYLGNLTKAVELFKTVHASTFKSGNIQSRAWGMLGQAENILPAGRTEEALALIREAEAMVVENHLGHDTEIRTYALLALGYFHDGQIPLALENAEKTAKLIAQQPPQSCYLLQHYAAVAEIYLFFWENTVPQVALTTEQLSKAALDSCKAVNKFAKIFPIGKARAAVCQGLYDWMSGKHDKAIKQWETAIAAAQQVKMPLEEALARYELGRHLPKNDPRRNEELNRACTIFKNCDATYYLNTAQAAMEA